MKKHEHTNHGAPDAMHELLCAYLLGEADADQAARVEAALEESEELRSQRDQLEQTLGLVREAFPGDEALSESAFADVLAKASDAVPEPEPVRPRLVLLRPTVMRAAAAILVVVTGTWAWIQRGARESLETSVARLDAEAPVRERLREIGYVDGADQAMDLKPLSYLGDDEQDRQASKPARSRAADYRDSKDAPETLRALGYSEEISQAEGDPDVFSEPEFEDKAFNDVVRIELSEQEVAAMNSIGYGGGDDDLASQPRFQHIPKKLEFGKSIPGSESAADNTGPGRARLKEIEIQASIQPAPEEPSDSKLQGNADAGVPAPRVAGESVANAAPQVVGEVQVQGGGKYGGRFGKKRGELSKEAFSQLKGLGDGGEVASAPSVKAPQPTGTYRGPGDTVVAGGAGPAKNQPHPVYTFEELDQWIASPDGGGVVTGSDTFFLGAGEEGEARRALTPEARKQRVREWCQTIIHDCYPRPRDLPRDMYFRFWGDNAFELTQLDAQSTFSVDVDTASYALARRYLNEGNLPTKAQIRTEEFLNAFDPDVPAPKEGVFAIQTELAPSRFSSDRPRSMLRVGIRGREVAKSERKPVAVTFVVDTSGSMREDGRLELVKHAMRLLVGELNAKDTIAIVAYSNDAHIVLPPTSADQGGVIESAIYPLQPNGSTNAEAGLTLGYQLAQAGLKAGHNNRVVFLSDGVANTGQTDQNRIIESVRRQVDAGIYLNTIGVGMDNHNDVFLEQLADKGDGICDYVDSPDAARRAIVERFTGAFETIASDVKVQVEFDPKQVHRYRLLGYENRAVADKDFRNDAVDAGEIGAGHQVVALYELELAEDASAQESPLATVHLRYKEPKAPGQDPLEVAVSEIDSKVFLAGAKQSFAEASPGYRRSVVVAQFAEFLRRSTHARGDAFEALLSETAELARELRTPEFDEFLGLVKKAYQLGPPRDHRDDAELTLDEFRRFQILRKEIEVLRKDVDDALLQELQERNDALEDQLRDLLQKRFEKNG